MTTVQLYHKLHTALQGGTLFFNCNQEPTLRTQSSHLSTIISISTVTHFSLTSLWSLTHHRLDPCGWQLEHVNFWTLSVPSVQVPYIRNPARWRNSWSRPSGVGFTDLAIFTSDEHSTGEKLSVSMQTNVGQRGSGHIFQKGTKLCPYLFCSKAWQAWKLIIAAWLQSRGMVGITNFIDSFATDIFKVC